MTETQIAALLGYDLSTDFKRYQVPENSGPKIYF